MGQVMPDVELFASGVYRGKPYTPADLDTILRNLHTLGRLRILTPPAVKGHEELDAEGNPTAAPERTDVPAEAWVDPETGRLKWKWDPLAGTWRKVLTATLGNVDPAMAKDIRLGRF